MVDWIVCFTVEFKDCTAEDKEMRLKAENIYAAAKKAEKDVEDAWMYRPDVDSVWVWNIGVVEDD